jgi:hypothetical protein
VYTSIHGDLHLQQMSRRTQVTLTDRQHSFLFEEAARTGLSMAELIRRAVDSVYRPATRPRLKGFAVNLAVARRPDAAVVGRVPPGSLDENGLRRR